MTRRRQEMPRHEAHAHDPRRCRLVIAYQTERGSRLVYLCPSDSIPHASYVFHADSDGARAYCSCEAYRLRGACNLTRNASAITHQLPLFLPT